MPAFRKHDQTAQTVWFNSSSLEYFYARKGKSTTSDFKMLSGNKEELDSESMLVLGQVMEEETVAVDWRQGDVIMVDNFMVMHGKESGTGPRSILISVFA